MDARESLRNVIMGVLVGIFMILPGASGATMAVVLFLPLTFSAILQGMLSALFLASITQPAG